MARWNARERFTSRSNSSASLAALKTNTNKRSRHQGGESSRQSAQNDLQEQILKILSNDSPSIKTKRCAHCGYMQSWMVDNAKRNIAWIWGIASLVLLALVTILLKISENQEWLCCGGGVVLSAIIGYAAYKLYDPNKNHPMPEKINKPYIHFTR